MDRREFLNGAAFELRIRPVTEELVRTIERHLIFGLGEPTKRWAGERLSYGCWHSSPTSRSCGPRATGLP
jgi:hypothetical protein